MKEIRYNETLDILELKGITFKEGKTNDIIFDHPILGTCTYWASKDKLHIHKNNDWKNNGLQILKTQAWN